MSKSNIPASRNPLLQQHQPLPFDDMSEEETLALTDEQRQDAFISRWMETFRPFSTFPRVFKEESNHARIFRDVKLFFKKYVIELDWTERKYAMVINGIFETRGSFTSFNVEKFGKLFDEDSLPAQRRLAREERRRGRSKRLS